MMLVPPRFKSPITFRKSLVLIVPVGSSERSKATEPPPTSVRLFERVSVPAVSSPPGRRKLPDNAVRLPLTAPLPPRAWLLERLVAVPAAEMS